MINILFVQVINYVISHFITSFLHNKVRVVSISVKCAIPMRLQFSPLENRVFIKTQTVDWRIKYIFFTLLKLCFSTDWKCACYRLRNFVFRSFDCVFTSRFGYECSLISRRFFTHSPRLFTYWKKCFSILLLKKRIFCLKVARLHKNLPCFA